MIDYDKTSSGYDLPGLDSDKLLELDSAKFLPEYDFRLHFPKCVEKVPNQGACNSGWAFATGTAAKNRARRVNFNS